MTSLPLLLLLSTLQTTASSDNQEQLWFAKARQYFEKQEWAKSEEAASKALEINPQLADAEILLGLVATAQRQYQTAETHFQKAVSLQPRNDLAQSYLANTYLQQKRLDKAHEAFAKTLQLNPKNQSASYNLGLIALMQQRPDEALRLFERVHRANPSDVPTLIGMLESQLLLKRRSEARQSVAKLSSVLKPENPALLQVATMLALHQDYMAAIPLMEQARQAFPNSYDISFNLALAYFRCQQYEKSREILQPLVNRDKKVEAYNLLGALQEKLGEQAQAAAALRQAMALEPGSEDFHFDYANHLLQFDTSQSAIDAFAAEVKYFPTSWRMRLGLGAANYLSGKYEDSGKALLQAVRLKPDSPLAFFLLGKVYESAESLQIPIYEALKAYCETKPADPWAYYHLGTILYLRTQTNQSADFQQAKAMLEEATQRNSNFSEAYLQLGLIAQAEERWGEAIRYLEKAIRLNTKIPASHYRLGLAYQRVGEKEKAKAEFELFEKLKSEVQAGQDKPAVLRYLAEHNK